MTKKSKIELNRATELTEIDAELDDALAKLEATSSRVDELLASESGPASSNAARSSDEEVDTDDTDESEEE